jgi:hypothetical protein
MSILVKSLSDPSIEYEIDLEELTCTCTFFLLHCYRYSKSDPHRLCKHLIQILIQKGIPEILKPYEEQIIWCAARGIRYMTKITAKKKIKEPLSIGSIETISAQKKVKYLYLAGTSDGKTIHATITLKDGDTSFQINTIWGFYNPQTNKSTFPKIYQYMRDAVLKWIDDEYHKSTGISFEKPVEQYIPEGTIVTTTREIGKGQKNIGGYQFGLAENNDEYYFLIGESWEYDYLEALIPIKDTIVYFSINQSSFYCIEFEELKGDGWSINRENLPGGPYKYMVESIRLWLNEEHNKIKSL